MARGLNQQDSFFKASSTAALSVEESEEDSGSNECSDTSNSKKSYDHVLEKPGQNADYVALTKKAR